MKFLKMIEWKLLQAVKISSIRQLWLQIINSMSLERLIKLLVVKSYLMKNLLFQLVVRMKMTLLLRLNYHQKILVCLLTLMLMVILMLKTLEVIT